MRVGGLGREFIDEFTPNDVTEGHGACSVKLNATYSRTESAVMRTDQFLVLLIT